MGKEQWERCSRQRDSTSKGLGSARHWGCRGRSEAGRVGRVQDLQAQRSSDSGLIVLGSHGGVYAREGGGQVWALGRSF